MSDQDRPPSRAIAADGGDGVQSDADTSTDNTEVLTAWRGAFGLERWFFIARGPGDQVTPMAMEVDGSGVMCVFTSPDLARRFGLNSGLPEQEAGKVMAIPVGSAVDYLLQFGADGITALVLDPGTANAAVLLAALPHLRELAKEGG